jgi:hypothetical protein
MYINIRILFCVIFLIYGCGEKKEPGNSTKQVKGTKVTPIEVKIAVFQKKVFESTIQAQGELQGIIC